jgi:hemoglobin/transferrin/lactoferrin receptor protein
MRPVLCATALVSLGAPALSQELLDTILVETAARDARPLLETPTAVTVIERETLERRQANTFHELIGDAPGVSIGGGPRGIAQEPNIRGFTDEQVVLRLDGGRFNFNQAHRGRFFLDPDIVERVEVVRGGGSTLYGSGALGGVIAVETRDAADLLRPGQTVGGRVRAGYASNGDIGSFSGTAAAASGGFDALGFLGWRPQGSDLQDGGGDDIRDSRIDVLNGLGKFGVNAGESHRFELTGAYYADEGTTPPNANAAASLTNVVDRDATVGTLRGRWDYAPAGSAFWNLSTLIYFNDTTVEEDRNFDGRADETDYTTFGLDLVNRSQADLGLPVTFVYGVEAYRDEQTGRRDGAARPEFPDAAVDFAAAFVEATVRVTDGLELIPGVRFDRFDLDPDSAAFDDRSEDQLSPRFGVSWRPVESLQLYGSLSRAFRAPSLTELYTDGVHFSTPGFSLGPGRRFSGVNSFVPNPDLEPERATQVEIGARHQRRDVLATGDRLTLQVGGYYADVRDFVDQRVTFVDFSTATFVPGVGLVVGGTTTSENVDAELWGFEAEARYDAGLWFAGLGAMLPRGEGADGEALGSIPQDRLNLVGGYRPAEGVEVGGRITLAAEQDDVPEGTEASDGFATLDLFASWRPERGPFAGAVLQAGVDNVFDEDFTIYPNGLPEAGRSFKIAAAFTF